jgi:hypothetical protein
MHAVVAPAGHLLAAKPGGGQSLSSVLAERVVVEGGAADAEDDDPAGPLGGDEVVDPG